MRGETYSETKDQLSTAEFDKVGRQYSSSKLNALVVLESVAWARESVISHLRIRLTRALKQNYPGAVKANQRKMDVANRIFATDFRLVKRPCDGPNATSSARGEERSTIAGRCLRVSLGPTQK